MKSKKIIAIIAGVLCVMCLVFGLVGFLQSKRTPAEKPTRNYQVTYKYYLNDVEVSQMPVNPKQIVDDDSSTSSTEEMSVEELYTLNTASCTNNVTYTWDAENWVFTPDNTADATCSLYFVTTYNVVKIEVANGKVNTPTEMKVKRGEDAVIKITPTEGYEFEKVECTNEQMADWDNDAKELIVRGVISETSCKASFAISKFSIDVQVNMGTGSTKVEYDYGKLVEIKNVTPAEEYGNPDIVCTNDQKATWKDNTLLIEKLTNNTKCIVTFKKMQSKTEYTAVLNVGTNGTIISGANPTKVLADGSVSWNVRVAEGYKPDGITCRGGNGDIKPSESDYIVTLKNVTEDAECSIFYKQGE